MTQQNKFEGLIREIEDWDRWCKEGSIDLCDTEGVIQEWSERGDLEVIKESLQKAAAYDAIADDLKELSGIDYAVTDAVLVFERLKHNKPDNHIYHLLHENCKRCLNIISRIKEKINLTKEVESMGDETL